MLITLGTDSLLSEIWERDLFHRRWEIIPPAMMWAKVISLSNEVMNNLKLQCIQSQ